MVVTTGGLPRLSIVAGARVACDAETDSGGA